MTCGEVRTSDCGALTLVCNLEAAHEGDHGIRESAELPPYVTWPREPWTVVRDRDDRDERNAWRKGHKRRAYQTLGMWKARQV